MYDGRITESFSRLRSARSRRSNLYLYWDKRDFPFIFKDREGTGTTDSNHERILGQNGKEGQGAHGNNGICDENARSNLGETDISHFRVEREDDGTVCSSEEKLEAMRQADRRHSERLKELFSKCLESDRKLNKLIDELCESLQIQHESLTMILEK